MLRLFQVVFCHDLPRVERLEKAIMYNSRNLKKFHRCMINDKWLYI